MKMPKSDEIHQVSGTGLDEWTLIFISNKAYRSSTSVRHSRPDSTTRAQDIPLYQVNSCLIIGM